MPESTYATLVSAANGVPTSRLLSLLLSADSLAAPHIGSVSNGFAVELELRNLAGSQEAIIKVGWLPWQR